MDAKKKLLLLIEVALSYDINNETRGNPGRVSRESYDMVSDLSEITKHGEIPDESHADHRRFAFWG